MEQTTVPFYELIPHEERIPKGWKLSAGATNENLAHCWRQVSDCRLILTHPFGQPLVPNLFLCRYKQPSTKEERRKYIPLYWVMSYTCCISPDQSYASRGAREFRDNVSGLPTGLNKDLMGWGIRTREHCKLILFSKIKGFCHPRKVVCERKMTSIVYFGVSVQIKKSLPKIFKEKLV